jgi:hypothetical protein
MAFIGPLLVRLCDQVKEFFPELLAIPLIKPYAVILSSKQHTMDMFRRILRLWLSNCAQESRSELVSLLTLLDLLFVDPFPQLETKRLAPV